MHIKKSSSYRKRFPLISRQAQRGKYNLYACLCRPCFKLAFSHENCSQTYVQCRLKRSLITLYFYQTLLEQIKRRYGNNYPGLPFEKITTTVGLNSKLLFKQKITVLTAKESILYMHDCTLILQGNSKFVYSCKLLFECSLCTVLYLALVP